MAINIKIGAKLDTKGLESQLKSEINKLQNNSKIKLQIDNKGLNLGNISSEIKKVSKELQKDFNLDGITKSAHASAQVFEKEINSIGETIGKLHQKSDFKLNTKEALQEAKEVNRALEEQYKLEQQMAQARSKSEYNSRKRNEQEAKNHNKILEEQYKLEQQIASSKAKMQGNLNSLKGNGFLDTSVLNNIQNRLNAINTNTPEKEIKELENALKNLGSAEPQIQRVQNALEKASMNLSKSKEKLSTGSFTNTDKITSDISKYESEVNKLKSVQEKLQGGTSFNGAKISSQINAVTNAGRNMSNSFKEGSTHIESFGSKLKSALGDVGFCFSAYQGIQMVTGALKEGIQTITEIDTKMRDLKRVADDAPAEALANFPLKANESAIALGQTTESAIQATTVWKQLGYTFEEASGDLSKWSMVLANVGDMSAEESTSALVSTLKAFKLETKDVASIVDVANEAGNRFALTSKDMAEGLRIGGASLAVAHNDLYQSSALITAGTEVLRDSNIVATGLKTIAMRLDEVKTSGGDTFFKLKDDLKGIAGVDLTDSNDELRSTYDIIVDLSKVWGSLSNMDQAKLLEEIAGKNQANFSPYVQKCA